MLGSCDQPTSALLNIVRQLIRSGAAADRLELVRALRSAGYPETHAPGFDADIAALRNYTREECGRLARHAVLDADSLAPVDRECLPALSAAIDGGSLLVIGEPGAGKTGVLVALANQSLNQSAPLVFLSVDRLGGVSTLSALKGELGLQHDLLDVLAAWPLDQQSPKITSWRVLGHRRWSRLFGCTSPIIATSLKIPLGVPGSSLSSKVFLPRGGQTL